MLKNMRLSVKLIGGFVVVALVTLAVGYTGWSGVSNLQDVYKEAEFIQNIQAQMLQKEIDHLNWARKVGQFQRDESMTTLPVQKDPHKCAFGKWYYSEDRKNAEAKIPGIASLLANIEEYHNNLHKSAHHLEAMLQKGKDYRAQALDIYNNETSVQLKKVQELLNEIGEKAAHRVDEIKKQAESQSAHSRLITLIGMALGFVVALVLGILLTLSITRPLNRAIVSMNDGSDQVASAASEVSSASQSLAQGSSEQAASLEETSASLEEMASMTRTNAENARQADTLMGDTSRVVDTANTSMTALIQSMKEVSAASEETAKIIKTIDEIAFQTNLLALNAAVEAARAGEAGAGFAVVADEVRSLAMRAADAAKNTAAMIEDTVDKVKEGSGLVTKTADAFSQVAGSTGKVKELVAEIAAASGEQAQGVDQINKAVTEMNKVTQQNAANAEESASASEELTAQSEQMKVVVGELVALAGGMANGGNGHHSVLARPSGGTKNRLTAVHKILGSGRSQATAKSLTPEQIIPLDDEDFKDF